MTKFQCINNERRYAQKKEEDCIWLRKLIMRKKNRRIILKLPFERHQQDMNDIEGLVRPLFSVEKYQII